MPEDAGRIDAARLVDDHLAAVYRYAYRLCGSAADAEDLTQDVFLAAQRKLGQLRNLDSARAWLYSILRNCFLKTRSRPAPVPAASLQLNLGSIPEEPTERAEIDQERLEQALAELPENSRIVLLMFYFENRSYRDIAEELDLPMGTVMSRLARAKGHLRSRLFEHEMGVGGSVHASAERE